MRVIATTHAVQRAEERFPKVFFPDEVRRTKDVLLAIGYRGEPTGESFVLGFEFKKGNYRGYDIVVVLKDIESKDGVQQRLIVTCLTVEEFNHNGNNKGRWHGNSPSVLQEI